MIRYILIQFPDKNSWGFEIGKKEGYKTLTNARKAARKALENYRNGGAAFVTIRKEETENNSFQSGIIETIKEV